MKTRLGRLKTEREVHQFWSRRDLAGRLHEMEEVDERIQLDPALAQRIRERTKKKMIALRLELWQLERAKAIAKKRRVPYQHLLRYWISKGLRQEAALKANSASRAEGRGT